MECLATAIRTFVSRSRGVLIVSKCGEVPIEPAAACIVGITQNAAVSVASDEWWRKLGGKSLDSSASRNISAPLKAAIYGFCRSSLGRFAEGIAALLFGTKRTIGV